MTGPRRGPGGSVICLMPSLLGSVDAKEGCWGRRACQSLFRGPALTGGAGGGGLSGLWLLLCAVLGGISFGLARFVNSIRKGIEDRGGDGMNEGWRRLNERIIQITLGSASISFIFRA